MSALFKKLIKLLLAVFLTESINTTAGIKQFLFACIKRVAFRTNVNMHVLVADRGTCGKAITAAAGNLDFSILWMDVGLHGVASCIPLSASGPGLISDRFCLKGAYSTYCGVAEQALIHI